MAQGVSCSSRNPPPRTLPRKRRPRRRRLAPRRGIRVCWVKARPCPVWLFVSKIATTEAPVLIRGEQGVGKLLVAEMIHAQSRRSAGKLVHIPCKGIREADIEGTLFGSGHLGADGESRRGGMSRFALGGTLFLADVESMPLGGDKPGSSKRFRTLRPARRRIRAATCG